MFSHVSAVQLPLSHWLTVQQYYQSIFRLIQDLTILLHMCIVENILVWDRIRVYYTQHSTVLVLLSPLTSNASFVSQNFDMLKSKGTLFCRLSLHFVCLMFPLILTGVVHFWQDCYKYDQLHPSLCSISEGAQYQFIP